MAIKIAFKLDQQICKYEELEVDNLQEAEELKQFLQEDLPNGLELEIVYEDKNQ